MAITGISSDSDRSDKSDKTVHPAEVHPAAPAHVRALTDERMQDEVRKHWSKVPAVPAVPTFTEPDFSAKVMAMPVLSPEMASMSPGLRAHSSYSMTDLLYREEYVLAGAGETMDGAKDRAKEAAHNWPVTGVELVSGVALGSLMVLASRNPALAVPIRILNKTMITVAAADLIGKVAVPSFDALANPERTDHDKHALGRNLGAAVFDYGMAAIAGGAGSRAVAPLIERTQLGSLVQGYDFVKTPGGAEMRIFKSGNALISKNGVNQFKVGIDPDLEPFGPEHFDASGAESGSGSGIVGDNDLLRRTYNDGVPDPKHVDDWKSGKDVSESAGKFGKWFETFAGALATEITERTADVGLGLIEHDYLIKQLEDKPGEDKKPQGVPTEDKPAQDNPAN